MPDRRNPDHRAIRPRLGRSKTLGLVSALVLIPAIAGSAIAQTAMPTASTSAESTAAVPTPAGRTAAPHKKVAGRRAGSRKTTIAKPVQPAATPATAPAAVRKTKDGESPAAASASASKAETARSKEGPFQSLRLSSDRGPVDIRADSMELDYKANVLWYRGHVRVKQGSASLSSDVLQVIATEKMADLREVIATGNVRMSQGGRWATSDRAKLNQANHTLEMTGSPVIHDVQDEVAGTRILIYLDTEKSVVDNAHAVIFPRKSEDRDDEQAPTDHDR